MGENTKVNYISERTVRVLRPPAMWNLIRPFNYHLKITGKGGCNIKNIRKSTRAHITLKPLKGNIKSGLTIVIKHKYLTGFRHALKRLDMILLSLKNQFKYFCQAHDIRRDTLRVPEFSESFEESLYYTRSIIGEEERKYEEQRQHKRMICDDLSHYRNFPPLPPLEERPKKTESECAEVGIMDI